MIQIKKETAYIDGYLTPYIESINTSTTAIFMDRSVMTRFNSTYSRTVYNNGTIRKANYVNNIKKNMLQEIDQFDNSWSSYNITDLFSLIYHNSVNNETTYTNGPKRLELKFCPNKVGILHLITSKNTLTLNKISLFDYFDIDRKQNKLYEALKHIIWGIKRCLIMNKTNYTYQEICQYLRH